MKIDLQKYTEFVQGVTSKDSENTVDLLVRIADLQQTTPDLNVSLVLTAAMGLAGEAGEFSEIFKKMLFHGKDFTEETRAHAAKELGDVAWYWINACRALNLDPDQVMADNVSKLESRYPGGKFSIEASANRAEGDI